ncbi:MAG: DNA-protecting protein DprA [Actinobacteria bacterium]|nr:DNA-processing protein DprA [Actinomycetota bacterium]MCB9412866.1 DNA-protecting protein DprA [Actinomycetota bacterium]
MTGAPQIHPAQQALPMPAAPRSTSADAIGRSGGDAHWEAEVRARIALSLLAEPGDSKVGAEVGRKGPERVAAELERTRLPARSASPLAEAVATQLERAAALGARCLLPGYPGWPTQLDDLGDAKPFLLWVTGESVRLDLVRSVSIVGARACSPYGRMQAETIAAELALFGWTVVSGGAYGIDAAAHQGALAVGGRTVLVSAGGVDKPYPRAHEHLFRRVQHSGAVVSECPLGAPPARHRFLTRNRLIAALSRGTIVVEAALKSGARSTAAAAARISRHVMAVPGPVDSDLSTGCHDLIRNQQAILVGGTSDVLEVVTPLGESSALSTVGRSVLGWLVAKGPLDDVQLAADIGLPREELVPLLALLEGGGYLTRSRRGWQLTDEALTRFAKSR